MTAEAYIRRETLAGIFINAAFSLLFFWLIFGGQKEVQIFGLGQWLFDFLPQSFMIGFAGTLVTGAIAAKKRKAGNVQPLVKPSRMPRSLLLRALLLGVVTGLIGVTFVGLIVTMVGVTHLDPTTAMVLKIGYGGLLSVLLTPLALGPALAES